MTLRFSLIIPKTPWPCNRLPRFKACSFWVQCSKTIQLLKREFLSAQSLSRKRSLCRLSLKSSKTSRKAASTAALVRKQTY